MRSIICILTFLQLTCGPSLAKPAFGIKGGVNFAGATFDPEAISDIESRICTLVGMAAETSLNSKNTILGRLEAMVVQKGWRMEYEALGYKNEASANIDEFVLAPSLVVRFPSEKLTPYIMGGMELGINLDAKYKTEFLGSTIEGGIDDWSKTNAGLNIGAGGAIPTGQGEIIVEIRYNLGLYNMITDGGEQSIKTNGTQVVFGYMFSVATK